MSEPSAVMLAFQKIVLYISNSLGTRWVVGQGVYAAIPDSLHVFEFLRDALSVSAAL